MNKQYFVHESSYVDQPCIIGARSKIWHFSHIMENSIIGEECNIGQNVVISPNVVLGKNVKVQNNVSIYTGVICEDHVFIGPSVVFTNVINPRSAINRKEEYKKTLLKTGCSIGANATIVCGNTIGSFALVGAGSVVTKEVPDFAIVAGNPAKIIGWISKHGERLNFINGKAVCKSTSEVYYIRNKKKMNKRKKLNKKNGITKIERLENLDN